MKTAILLDWDGVLCDSLILYYELYIEVCRRHNHPFPIADLADFRDWYNPRWEENFYDLGFSEAEYQEVLKYYEENLRYSGVALFPGIIENLALWSAEFPLAIVSTAPSWMIWQRLRQDDLEKYFTHLTGSDDGDTEKRGRVRVTMELMGAQAGVMVGDTPLDIEAGKFNALKTIGVTYGWFPPARIRQAAPDRGVDEPGALYQAVVELARA